MRQTYGEEMLNQVIRQMDQTFKCPKAKQNAETEWVSGQLDTSSAATLKFDHGKSFTQGCSILACVIFLIYNGSNKYLLRFL